MRKKDEGKAEKEYEKMPYPRLFSHREEIADVRCKRKDEKNFIALRRFADSSQFSRGVDTGVKRRRLERFRSGA